MHPQVQVHSSEQTWQHDTNGHRNSSWKECTSTRYHRHGSLEKTTPLRNGNAGSMPWTTRPSMQQTASTVRAANRTSGRALDTTEQQPTLHPNPRERTRWTIIYEDADKAHRATALKHIQRKRQRILQQPTRRKRTACSKCLLQMRTARTHGQTM